MARHFPRKLLIPLLLIILRISYQVSYPILALGLIACHIARLVYTTHKSEQIKREAAKQHGASIIPRVRGRLPLNFDVLLAWLHNADEDVGRLFHDLAVKYGSTFNTRVLGEDQILSIDPDVFDAVMKDQFRSFHKGPKFHHRTKGLLGEGIFSSDGQQWAKHRQTLRPFFKQDRYPRDTVRDLLSRALDAQIDRGPFDAQALFGSVALDIAILFITGSGPLKEDTWAEDKMAIAAALAEGQHVMGRRLKVGSIWPIFELRRDGLKGPAYTLKQFFQPYIARAIRRRGSRVDATGHSDLSLLERLVDTDNDEGYITEQLINVLLAARDTTTSMLTFLTYTIITQTAEFRRLLASEPSSSAIEKHGEDPRQAFILETLRIFPPVPLNIRRAVTDTVLPGGLYIPAGVSIVLSTVNLQRSKMHWGEDADEFRPDRMLDTEAVRSRFKTFNVGPRTCPGRNLALTVARIWLDMVLDSRETEGIVFKLAKEAQPLASRVPMWWSSDEGDGRGRGGREQVWPISDIILTVKGGLWISVDRR